MPEKHSTSRKSWDREELLLVMNLYCRIPFGRQHSRAAEVIELAQALGRSPGSVAMKLNNFTALDPEEKARGVRGLQSASNLDRQVWEEFHRDWEKMAEESEALWQQKIVNQSIAITPVETMVLIPKRYKSRIDKITAPQTEPTGPTQGERIVQVRFAQVFFRRTVLTAYGVRCCISGNPVPGLLIASHILPWSQFPEHRINPRNGLCLSRLHDAAFDQGLITFDEHHRLALSHEIKYYLPNDTLQQNFVIYEGRKINLPEKFHPQIEFLNYHRENVFKG
jgi:predicted restriction endonuclease